MADNGGVISSKLFLITANYWLMNEAVVNCDLQINISGVIAQVEAMLSMHFQGL